MLLVLDNFEQLAGLGEPVVAHLAALLPQLHLLVTSRRALGLDGEREFAVAALELPHTEMALDQAAANPAVALFVDRARAVRADFCLNAPKREAVIELVRELEGMPLAIELAASRVRSFSPADMLALLRRAAREPATGATPRLDLLARSGPRAGLDPRHASMQRVIEWSWRQLTPAQTRLLGALTVFHGGATAQAVRSVHGGGAGEAQLLLDELQSQSLLHSHEALSGELRFSLSEPIREFAAARVDAAAAAQWRARHRAWLIGWAASFGPTPALDAVRAEMPNLLAALASSVADAAPHDAVHLIIALRRTLEDVELPAEGLSRLQAAVEHCTDPLLQSRGHTLLGPMLFTAGRKEDALRHAERGLAGAPADPSLRARALHAVARVRWRSSRRAEGLEAMLDEAQALAEAAGDTEVQASVYALRAFITNTHYRDHAAGIALHIRALAFWETTGNQHAIDSGRYNLAVSVQNAGRHDEALTRLAEIVDSARAARLAPSQPGAQCARQRPERAAALARGSGGLPRMHPHRLGRGVHARPGLWAVEPAARAGAPAPA